MRAKLLSCLLSFSIAATPQNYRFTTIAGFGTFGGDGGPATSALVNPSAVAVAADGTIYVADALNYRIRKIDRLGNISTVIGNGAGTFSGDGGPAASAQMSASNSIAVDGLGNIYFTDEGNLRIREVTAAGVVKTIAGNGTCGTVTAGSAATSAPLCDVESVAVDAQGRVYFGSDSRIWMVNADGTLTLIAGTGMYGSTGDGGLATAAQIGFPGSLAIDQNGNLYLGDSFNFAIRKITPDNRISTVGTVAGNSSTTIALALDAVGTLFYGTGTRTVFKLGGENVATLPPTYDASCLAIDSAGVFYSCSINRQRLMKISGGTATAIAGAYPYAVDSSATLAKDTRLHLNPLLIGLAVDSANNVYFPELDGELTQRIDQVGLSGQLLVLNTPPTLPTNGAFTVQAVTIGTSGAVYFSTFTQVYRLESGGTVTLIAGAPGFPAALGDGGPATAAKLSNPSSIVFDPSGNLYIAEPFESRVRKVTTQGNHHDLRGNKPSWLQRGRRAGLGRQVVDARRREDRCTGERLYRGPDGRGGPQSDPRRDDYDRCRKRHARIQRRRGPGRGGEVERSGGDRHRSHDGEFVYRRPAIRGVHNQSGEGQQPHSDGQLGWRHQHGGWSDAGI